MQFRRLSNKHRNTILLAGLIAASTANAQGLEFDGNLKYQLVNTTYPAGSLIRDLTDKNVADHAATARFNIAYKSSKWAATASYQAIGLAGDTVELTSGSTAGQAGLIRSPLLSDQTQLFDLTSTVDDGNRYALAHRLDRLTISYQGSKNVIRVGRQAVSWGNGLIYTPMDFFNPFDPTTIDTEYKPGADMLYAQHLLDSGNDLQWVSVFRRNESGRTSASVNSHAIKYHGFFSSAEYDLLLAEHFDDTIIAVGGSTSLGGSVVRGDWVITDTEQDTFHSLVANISYSWVWRGKNMTGSLEYFHNDFGEQTDQLALTDLAANPALANRVARGELFTLGRDYLAGSATIEINPLWNLTPNLFVNLTDNSAFSQLISQHSLSDNLQLIGAVSLPIGPRGTEFGGLPTGPLATSAPRRFSNSSWSLFGQLAWYF
ncbi:MAG: hypothetical protein AAF431_13005 [Pseudomonadota bacterium]